MSIWRNVTVQSKICQPIFREEIGSQEERPEWVGISASIWESNLYESVSQEMIASGPSEMLP